MLTVGIPAASIVRAISPTDWLHSPQAGVSSTASTCCCLSSRATSGALR